MAEIVSSNAILYHDEDWSITLMDIPKSIEDAQDFGGEARILSCDPMNAPFQSTEPKSKKAQSKISNFSRDNLLHDDIAKLAQIALEHLDTRSIEKVYCLPRKVQPMKERPLKRKGGPGADVGSESDRNQEEDQDHAVGVDLASNHARLQEHWKRFEGLALGKDEDEGWLFERSFFNTSGRPKRIRMTAEQTPETIEYLIPPGSFSHLSRCEETSLFRSAAKKYASGDGSHPGRFDLILMDPPWPNLSAKRKQAYDQAYNLEHVADMLLGLDLDLHVGPGGFVAVWITNNPNIRELVVGSGGLFEAWNVLLLEEWVWVKVTSKGEPLAPIDGVWRKPHETLLVGKAPEDRYVVEDKKCFADMVRRVIIAVPDLHSRKPCLQQLFERVLLRKTGMEYRALEIFARHLVKGWMSWGDETLKFNDVRQWHL